MPVVLIFGTRLVPHLCRFSVQRISLTGLAEPSPITGGDWTRGPCNLGGLFSSGPPARRRDPTSTCTSVRGLGNAIARDLGSGWACDACSPSLLFGGRGPFALSQSTAPSYFYLRPHTQRDGDPRPARYS